MCFDSQRLDKPSIVRSAKGSGWSSCRMYRSIRLTSSMGRSSNPSGSSWGDSGWSLFIVSLWLGLFFSKTSSCCSLLVRSPISSVERRLFWTGRTPCDRVLARLRSGLDMVGSMRENDLELWDMCGRPSSPFMVEEDMILSVPGDPMSAEFSWNTISMYAYCHAKGSSIRKTCSSHSECLILPSDRHATYCTIQSERGVLP